MAAYLIDNPPASPQYRSPRREQPSGVVVVHTAENTPDTIGLDGAAEAVANFIRNRRDPGSYHDLVDSDSIVNLVPYTAEAYHDGTGSNRHSYGVSAATRASQWPDLPQQWVDATIHNMAAATAVFAIWLKATRGIVIPARRITRAESDARIPGFISHAERDPANRSDPGADFPWGQFLSEYDRLVNPAPSPTPLPPSEDDMKRYLMRAQGDPAVYLVEAGLAWRWWIPSVKVLGDVVYTFQQAGVTILPVPPGGEADGSSGAPVWVVQSDFLAAIPALSHP